MAQVAVVGQIAVALQLLVIADDELALGAEVDTEMIEQQPAHQAGAGADVAEHEDRTEACVPRHNPPWRSVQQLLPWLWRRLTTSMQMSEKRPAARSQL